MVRLPVDPNLWKREVGRSLVDHGARVAHERS